MDEPVLRWGRSVGIRGEAPSELGPGEAVGVLSSIEPTGQQGDTVVVEYLVGGKRAEVPRRCLEELDTRAWFEKLGWKVVTRQDDGGSFAADLDRLGRKTGAVRGYGIGDSPESAIESARRRYFVEQIGSEAERRPRRPLP